MRLVLYEIKKLKISLTRQYHGQIYGAELLALFDRQYWHGRYRNNLEDTKLKWLSHSNQMSELSLTRIVNTRVAKHKNS